jgi:hypothetical protein
MTAAGAEAWFTARTAGAPEALRRRAEQFFGAASPADLATRLSDAGYAALGAAMRDGGDRAAALDLLAADALITLALLAGAEGEPISLGRTAAALRIRASVPPDSHRD